MILLPPYYFLQDSTTKTRLHHITYRSIPRLGNATYLGIITFQLIPHRPSASEHCVPPHVKPRLQASTAHIESRHQCSANHSTTCHYSTTRHFRTVHPNPRHHFSSIHPASMYPASIHPASNLDNNAERSTSFLHRLRFDHFHSVCVSTPALRSLLAKAVHSTVIEYCMEDIIIDIPIIQYFHGKLKLRVNQVIYEFDSGDRAAHSHCLNVAGFGAIGLGLAKRDILGLYIYPIGNPGFKSRFSQ